MEGEAVKQLINDQVIKFVKQNLSSSSFVICLQQQSD